MYLSLLLRLLAFPKISEKVDTREHKKVNHQHNREIKISQIMVSWSDREIKIPCVVFRLNREIKMPRNSIIVKKTPA